MLPARLLRDYAGRMPAILVIKDFDLDFAGLVEFICHSDADVCIDSRLVKGGDVFAAIEGAVADGHDFVLRALENGAEYIICSKECSCPEEKMVVVEDTAEAFGVLSQAKFGYPSNKLINLAVTGTNGKTTVCFLTRAIIEAAEKRCGLIGTILYDTGAEQNDAPLTTPDAGQIAQLAASMVDNGAEFMAIEASSHALSQRRLAGLKFSAAAFTNLTGDHLDYHNSRENYLAAKSLLFEKLDASATAVLNRQSPESNAIAENTAAKILWYGIDVDADVAAEIVSMEIGRTVYNLHFDGQCEEVTTSLIGRHNISNHLAAAGLAIAAGIDLKTVAKGLSGLVAVDGRLESVDCGQEFSVLVDYAHTDDALKNVLSTLRPLCTGKLTVVFGCGGDRDKTKRPRMAKEAQALANRIIVTSDNPRTENAGLIIDDIMAGFTDIDSLDVTAIEDRRAAIEFAISSANKDDIVLIAGKGHETYQIIGETKYDFDDRQIAKYALANVIG
ncbi:MAG: UDP-N-acetylmuramoyl-L-alanyl-D-glutamate--2,6-diaminopimelate ligase [Planctomycetes bacterium]|nr:UDP-N-acetylmuramoyl-L-alanyl-D-glutamate--2,6-diaminopimelate ligase [Planctomycetota bacterium]